MSQPATFPAPRPSGFAAPDLSQVGHQLPLGDVIDEEMIAHYRRDARFRLVVVVVAVAGAVLAFKFLPGAERTASYRRRRSNPQNVGAAVCLMIAVFAGARLMASHRLVTILRGARWHRSTFSTVRETRGEFRIHHLTLDETGLTYRPMSRVLTVPEYHAYVEWAGDPTGVIAIRKPGTAKVHVYRPVTADEAKRDNVRWKK
ncbi:MAG: hypothetical protein M9961_00375 [Ilumatobacteraceae bacterium]|nr:hypothetical protein [Ilumatobacter sp.]MCO5328519.1 hypothetical protein [Ilumatobacteraceae bacterium]